MNKKDKYYYKDGTISSKWDGTKILHRIGGPAVEYASGAKAWYVDYKRHRTEGPAEEWVDGSKDWFIDDKEYTEEEFNQLIKEVNEMSPAMKLIDPRWWVRELGKKEKINFDLNQTTYIDKTSTTM